MVSASGRPGLISAILFLMPSIIASVEMAPLLRTVSRTERAPLTCTMFVCGGLQQLRQIDGIGRGDLTPQLLVSDALRHDGVEGRVCRGEV